MKKNSLLVVIVGVLSFLFGFIGGCFFTSWCQIETNFYHIKLIEIIQLFVTIIIAITVSYFISGKVNRDIKKRDLIAELISKIQNTLADTLNSGYEYINNPQKERGRKVVINFKNLSMQLGIMSDLRKSDPKIFNYDDSIHSEFLKFKESLTDTPFGERKPIYNTERNDRIQNNFNLLSKRLHECKIKLYS